MVRGFFFLPKSLFLATRKDIIVFWSCSDIDNNKTRVLFRKGDKGSGKHIRVLRIDLFTDCQICFLVPDFKKESYIEVIDEILFPLPNPQEHGTRIQRSKTSV